MRKPIKRKHPEYKYNTAMLIDDNEMDNFINQKIIESSFFAQNIFINTNGISALEFIKNLQIAKNIASAIMPDVIFIDINMPLMDGFQFMDEFMKLPENINKKTKLVILTSSINSHDKSKILTYSNKVSFINKPLNEENLAAI